MNTQENTINDYVLDDRYTVFKIPKHRGGYRIIEAPNRQLQQKQRKLLKNVLYKYLSISPFAHGFVVNKSIVTNALPHVGKKYIIKFDIKDFFSSIDDKLFRKVFKSFAYSQYRNHYYNRLYNKNMYKLYTSNNSNKKMKKLYDQIIETCFVKEIDQNGIPKYRLPQGAPTSPHISNFIMRQFDWGIVNIIKNLEKYYDNKLNINYTRYADDITISMNEMCFIGYFKNKITKMLENLYDGKILLNEKKSICVSRKYRQLVCGLVVNDKVALPKEVRKKIKALHYLVDNNKIDITNEIRGLFALEKMVEKQSKYTPLTYDNVISEIKLISMLNEK